MTEQTGAHADTVVPHSNGYVSDWALEVPTSNQLVGTPDDRRHPDGLERVRGRLVDSETDPAYAEGVADALTILRQFAAGG